jgi:hypothetical protein
MENLDPIPTDLTSCFSVMDTIMGRSEPKEFEWFKNTDEDEVTTTTHHGFGRWIRNNWGLWDKESPLHQYFNKLGLWHADDMSSLIIKSYHRHINKKEINLKEQVDHYLEYWREYEQNNGPVQK